MNGIEIKVLGPHDAAVLDDIAPDVFDNPIVPAATKSFLDDPRHHVVVALDGEVVVGFVSSVHYVHPDKACPELWINEVGVAPNYHRRGIGRLLIERTVELARELGCREAWVLTDETNEAGNGLYASTGAQASGGQVMYTYLIGDP